MINFSMNDMQGMQRKLQEKYKDKWRPICPGEGRNKLLWMIAEIGEVIDIVKKQGEEKIMEDSALRKEFVEELADVLTYYNDIMLCFDISTDELKQIYVDKFERNMERW